MLVWEWWQNPEAGHGLLLAPLALYFAWKAGIDPAARPNRLLGISLMLGGVFFRWVSDLAAELFVMRGSMLMALAGIVAWYWGFRQLLRWWLPISLLVLSIPLPELVLSRIALPLQFTASKIGATLLASRDIPVLLAGNVIRIPGHQLFVAEACSGLRSLTALISLGVLLGAISLRSPIARAVLVASAIPVAILLNGVRVFLTGFLVFFVDPKLGEGFMHLTEGWLIFVVALVILSGIAWAFGALERRIARRGQPPQQPAAEVEEEDVEYAEYAEYADESVAEDAEAYESVEETEAEGVVVASEDVPEAEAARPAAVRAAAVPADPAGLKPASEAAAHA
jgi:exosortase